jgi:large subunit ribosomal protein L2
MPIKKYEPYTPSRRFIQIVKDPDLSGTQDTVKRLLVTRKSTGGRNSDGHVTLRFRGGGNRQKTRLIDFRRDKRGIPGKVHAVQYDPSRSANVALICYVDGEKRYILAPMGIKVGDRVLADENAPVHPGNALPLRNIPLGTMVHNIEFKPAGGGKVCRGAGSSAQILAKEGKMAQLRLPSGEVRNFPQECFATIGQVGNIQHENRKLGKAGATRWQGRRSHVRGTVMNPVDHPHGGGEGKSNSGRPPCSPWGVQAKGFRTRKRKTSDKLIIRRRYAK